MVVERAREQSGSQGAVLAGRYTLRGKVEVSSAEVMLQAVDRVLGMPRSIRVLRPELSRSPSHRRAFSASARTLVGLRHPHLREVHDLVSTERGLALVLAPVPGASLQARRRAGPMVIDEVVRIGLDGLAALQFLHERGFVHGDIRADAAWLEEDGRLVLGSPRVDSFEAENGQVVRRKGLAPELRADPRLATPSADLYAWAAVLYELIAGHPPRADLHTWQPKTLGPGVSAELVRVLAEAMAARPSDRPVSAQVMARKLAATRRDSVSDPLRGAPESRGRSGRGLARQHAAALRAPEDRPALVPRQTGRRWALWLVNGGRPVPVD